MRCVVGVLGGRRSYFERSDSIVVSDQRRPKPTTRSGCVYVQIEQEGWGCRGVPWIRIHSLPRMRGAPTLRLEPLVN